MKASNCHKMDKEQNEGICLVYGILAYAWNWGCFCIVVSENFLAVGNLNCVLTNDTKRVC